MGRVYAHSDLEEMAAHAGVPVINGLSDALHPCQVLADLQTINEHFGRLSGLKLCYVGDGNNMAHSLLLGCARVGMDVAVVTPPGYEPDAGYVAKAREHAAQYGSQVLVTSDAREGVNGAHAVYTDVWASMGQKEEAAERERIFADFQVNEALMDSTGKDTLFMHCLPAERGREVTDGVMEADYSIVFDEAENRMHAQNAIMVKMAGQ